MTEMIAMPVLFPVADSPSSASGGKTISDSRCMRRSPAYSPG